jgi:hypothetical protein
MPQATYPEPVVLKPMKYINATPVHNVLLQQPLPHLIDDDGNELTANIFCFGAFTDCHTGMEYNDLTGNFPSSHLTAALL